MGDGGNIVNLPRPPSTVESLARPVPAEPFTGLTVTPSTAPPYSGGVNLPTSRADPLASGPPGPAAGRLGAVKNMATEFGAAIAAEFLFFLLDKLLGGRLSGSARKIDASPQAMRQAAAQQQATAAAVTRQAGAIHGLATSMVGTAISSTTGAAFFRQLLKDAEAAQKAAQVQQATATKSIEISDIIGNAQGVFLMLVRKFGKSVMLLLNSLFGSFMAITVATLGFKIILTLVMRLIGEVAGKGDRAAADATAVLNGITTTTGQPGHVAVPALPPVVVGSGTGAGSIGGAIGPGAVPTVLPPGPGMTPTVLTSGPGVPGWTPTVLSAPPPGEVVAVTLQDGKVRSVEAPATRDYRVTVVSDVDGDGRVETQELSIDIDARNRASG